MGYLARYDLLSDVVKNYIDMPDGLVDLLIRFLRQNNGRLSARALTREFSALTAREIQSIENKYEEGFQGDV